MERKDGRQTDQLRKVWFTRDYLANPLSSVLVEFGRTRVVCAITIEQGVPGWMRAQKVPGGWLTCEYGMLPASTHDRMNREAARGKQSGRTMEIQRLIGRSLRAVVDLKKLGQNTIYIDCDVIDADGGTRCASINGASAALQLALRRQLKRFGGEIPMKENVAAVSVGMVDGTPVLDLCYEEDSRAEVDMNVVMTESGKFIEIQGTAEENPFSYEEMEAMLSLARKGCDKIFEMQNRLLNPQKFKKSANGGRGGRDSSKKDALGSIGDVLGEIDL